MLAQNEALKPKTWGEYHLYSLTNHKGTQVDISDLGAVIVNFFTQDKNGEHRNIVLGYDSPEQYIEGKVYFGCVVGPWANRIANAQYLHNGQTIKLETNEGPNHLHGASANIGAKRWNVDIAEENTLVMSVTMKANEAGYPASINFKVTYELTDNDQLKIEYSAVPDASVPINMTQHSYFNLSGEDDVLNHVVQIHSDKYLHVDSAAIPIEVRSVSNTPLDLRNPIKIGQSIDDDFDQLTMAGGYDHCWCFGGTKPNESLHRNATVTDNQSGLSLDVYSDQIGMQFYTGNFISGELGHNGKVHGKRAGFCLETQCYPNQVNMSNAADCIYNAGEQYRHRVIYQITK
ncbi:aldose epimerase family protein [Vibrio agarivorans]|uniref:Aldose 1-epimerase n=1 Tax=Vibrio agarivorans TaxID=153622 RepID=A0ABT7Y4I7_9VIBR|nr:aldose epimerase family protein [Vibrio agarivorans]MDN2482967.1 aldose epimerase family protein [Vibrio agarivorans]